MGALAAPSILIDIGNQTPDPAAAAMIRSLAAVVLSVFAPRVAALFMFSTASLGRATGALPRWLVVVTHVVGIGLLLNVRIAEPGLFVMPAWMVVVSVVLLVRPTERGVGLEPAPASSAS